jgi:hypothetical protein
LKLRRACFATSGSAGLAVVGARGRVGSRVLRARAVPSSILEPDHDALLPAVARLAQLLALRLLLGGRVVSPASPRPSRPLAQFAPPVVGFTSACVPSNRGVACGSRPDPSFHASRAAFAHEGFAAGRPIAKAAEAKSDRNRQFPRSRLPARSGHNPTSFRLCPITIE